jgi:hypothetical protein
LYGLGRWVGNNSSLALRPTLHKDSKAKVQLKSSIPIGAKVEISPPKGFTLGVKAEIIKKFFFPICPKLLLNAELHGLILAPRL